MVSSQNVVVSHPRGLGRGSVTVGDVDSPVKGDAEVLWLLDEGGNKKVVLVPRDADKKQATAAAASTQVASKLQQKQSLLQKLGLTKKKDHKKQKQLIAYIESLQIPSGETVPVPEEAE